MAPLVGSRSRHPARRECRVETSRRREIIDWRRSPRRNRLTKKSGCARFPEGLGAARCEGCGMRKSCRRVQPRSAGIGVPHAATRQIAKRMKIPNAAIVTRTPAIHMPISHRKRMISRCAASASRFAMSVRSLSKAASFFDIAAWNLSKAPSYFAWCVFICSLSVASSLETSRIVGSLTAQFPSQDVHQARIGPDAASPIRSARIAASFSCTLHRSARAVHPFFAKARRGRRQLARRSRARTDHRAAHPAGPSPPEYFPFEQSGHPVPFGRSAATRAAANLRKPSRRRLARRHPEASRAAASFRLAEPSKSKQNGMYPEMGLAEAAPIQFEAWSDFQSRNEH